MDHRVEYQDPDYPQASCSSDSGTNQDKLGKLVNIINREFDSEIRYKEEELSIVNQRLNQSRVLLNRLRYEVVCQYYNNQKLQFPSDQIQDEIAAQNEPVAKREVCALLRNEQTRLHPSIKKLLGSETADLQEIINYRTPRNKMRKDYLAMVKNYTIPAESNVKSLRPTIKSEATVVPADVAKRPSTATENRPKKLPRYIPPKIENVKTVHAATRNKLKHRYRIIIGNTSKYAPPSSKVDRSTHKWLLYVRGPPARPDISPIVTSVSVTLHDTYAPHQRVNLYKPPYHLSRRGWGEFPARIEMHFAQPLVNRPVTIDHTIKLDRNYTGLQTLGGETVVDVWLYSNEEMLKHEFVEDHHHLSAENEEIVETNTENERKVNEAIDNEAIEIKMEPSLEFDNDTTWMDFFASESKDLDVDEMIIKPLKKESETLNMEVEPKENKIEIKKEPCIQEEINADPTDWEDNVVANEIPKQNENLDETVPPKTPKRIMKYIDSTTGKIYYLEMDVNLDISKVQEIVINSNGNIKTAKISPIKPVNGVAHANKLIKKEGESLLRPEIKNLIKLNPKTIKNNYSHIENDHCYISNPKPYQVESKETVLPDEEVRISAEVEEIDNILEKLQADLSRFTCVRTAVCYLLSRIPLISNKYQKYLPFVVPTEEKYWTFDIVKRRNIEWSRAKFIGTILKKHFDKSTIWRTKQILLFAHLHGYYPAKPSKIVPDDRLLSSLDLQTSFKEIYPNPAKVDSLSVFDEDEFLDRNTVINQVDLTVDEDVDVECVADAVGKAPTDEKCRKIPVMPVENQEERLRFLFIEKKCADVGIELRNEDVGSGVSYSAVHAVMLCAVKKFAEEMVRASLAQRQMDVRKKDTGLPMSVWNVNDEDRPLIELHHVYRAVRQSARLDAMSSTMLGSVQHEYSAL